MDVHALRARFGTRATAFFTADDVTSVNRAEALAEARFDLLTPPLDVPADPVGGEPTPVTVYRDDPPPAPAPASQAKSTEDDFVADLHAFLSGQKAYDPNTKSMVSKEDLGKPRPDERPAPEAKNSQAIFDRITQSMQYANAYDIGTVELANRFADFDRLADLQRKAADKKPKAPPVPATGGPVSGFTPDTSEFIRDLDAIRTRPAVQAAASPPTAAGVPDAAAVPTAPPAEVRPPAAT